MADVRLHRADEDGAGAVIPGGLFLGYLYVVPTRWRELADCSSTLLWQTHDDTTTGRFASGRTKTMTAPTVSTEAAASGQPAASRMVRASG